MQLPALPSATRFSPKRQANSRLDANVSSLSSASYASKASSHPALGKAAARPSFAFSRSTGASMGASEKLQNARELPRTLKANVSYYPGRAYLQAMHSLPSTPSRKYVNTKRGQTLLAPLPRLPNGLNTHLAASLSVPTFKEAPPAPPEDMIEIAYGARRRDPLAQQAAARKLATSAIC
jgi:hypothetical protein